ncbi:MAG: helix-turn-helix domain-containing protein [Propionicimonas sp.]
MTVLRDPREVIREEPLMHAPILAAVADGPATIVEIAERTGHPAHEVVYWVMGMRRYGHLIESTEADDDGFFSYGAVGQGPAATLEECEYE